MKRIILAALLVALATPAWAFNEPSTDAERQAAYDLCREVGTNMHICGMMTASSEHLALEIGTALMSWCAKDGVQANPYAAKDCTDTRAYIKQRWGY